MAAIETGPHGFKKYTEGTDAFPGRIGHNEVIDLLNQLPGCGVGPVASRPVAASGLRFWFDDATGRLTVNNGTEWVGIADLGGVTPQGVAVGGNSGEGSSSRAARADHSHALPLATSTAHGAMKNTDRALIDAATSLPTANALLKRDASGRAQVAAPNVAGDVATKKYVDDGLGGKSATGHAHTNATTSAPGFMSAADKSKLDVIPTIGTWTTVGVFEAAEGWEMISGTAQNFGPCTSVYLRLKRTGPPVESNSTGDIGNVIIGALHQSLWPHPNQRQGALSTCSAGFSLSAYAASDGAVLLSAMPPGVAFATGDETSLQGMWMKS